MKRKWYWTSSRICCRCGNGNSNEGWKGTLSLLKSNPRPSQTSSKGPNLNDMLSYSPEDWDLDDYEPGLLINVHDKVVGSLPTHQAIRSLCVLNLTSEVAKVKLIEFRVYWGLYRVWHRWAQQWGLPGATLIVSDMMHDVWKVTGDRVFVLITWAIITTRNPVVNFNHFIVTYEHIIYTSNPKSVLLLIITQAQQSRGKPTSSQSSSNANPPRSLGTSQYYQSAP